MAPGGHESRSDEDLHQEARQLRKSGQFVEALIVYETLLERQAQVAAASENQRSERIEWLF